MNPVVVVGSGASGVHFACTALEKGRKVVMLDVGHTGPEPVLPTDTLNGLKRDLADPAAYFLGDRYQALVLPPVEGEYYAFPPSKDHVFRYPKEYRYRASGFAPLHSFAAGGLAETWTGGCYPFNDSELTNWPIGYADLEPYYSAVAGRIGITGEEDDMADVFPLHANLLPPLDLDSNSSALLDRYVRNRDVLKREKGCTMGRARVAVLSRDLKERKQCSYLGRCLWGCPSQSFYTPSVTLSQCRERSGFEYHSGLYVDHFTLDRVGRAKTVIARTPAGAVREFEVGALVMAAGMLSSAKVFLESMYQAHGVAPVLTGIMDNRQILMPFANLAMLGRPWSPDTYQYHQLAMAVQPTVGKAIHGLITTLKTALIHPLVQTLPFDLGTSASVFRHVHGALAMLNINLADDPREENYLTLDTSISPHRLVIHYVPSRTEPERLQNSIKSFRGILRKLGCFAPKSTIHVRPMGASVHYAGALPMRKEPTALTCSSLGRSYDVENLFFADGTSFPDLPAKNLTFTLMANASRIAQEAF